MWVGGYCYAPTALRPGMTRYPLDRRVGEPPGPVWTVREISPPQGFDPRTVQPVSRLYADYNIPVHAEYCSKCEEGHI